MLSKKTKYALQALIQLGEAPSKRPMLISELARRGRSPRKFLELILLALKNRGILGSKKGKGGGYFLAKPSAKIALGEVIRILDGPLAPLPCLSKTAYRKCDECEDERTCGIRIVMQGVYEATSRILDGTSLADMLSRVEQMRQKEKGILMYHI